MKGWITINTDAGYYPIEKRGSYAYWIRKDGALMHGSGMLKDKCSSSWEAEMKAIINALHVIDKKGFNDVVKIIFNRDNINTRSARKGNKLENHVYTLLKRICTRSGNHFNTTFYEFRHVKAHTGAEDKRSWVNQWCDKQCKARLKEWKQLSQKNINNGKETI